MCLKQSGGFLAVHTRRIRTLTFAFAVGMIAFGAVATSGASRPTTETAGFGEQPGCHTAGTDQGWSGSIWANSRNASSGYGTFPVRAADAVDGGVAFVHQRAQQLMAPSGHLEPDPEHPTAGGILPWS